jgi:hypothetical protein
MHEATAVPNFTIFMREETFQVLERLCRKENKSRGKIITEALMRYAAEKGIHSERT